MSNSANVQSIQSLKDFKVAMINFAEDARNSLSGVDMEVRRVRDWLERDQLGYWIAQIKKRQEDLMQARADLHRRKLSQSGSEAVSDADQKEALREATKRLQAAEAKVALIKRLIPVLHHAIDEYHSHSQPLGDHLAGGFEKSLASLEKMTAALDAYVSLNAPSAPRFDSAADSAGAKSAAAGSAATTTAEGESPAAAPADSAANGTAAKDETPAPALKETAISGRTS
jgi:hypothetical protein